MTYIYTSISHDNVNMYLLFENIVLYFIWKMVDLPALPVSPVHHGEVQPMYWVCVFINTIKYLKNVLKIFPSIIHTRKKAYPSRKKMLKMNDSVAFLKQLWMTKRMHLGSGVQENIMVFHNVPRFVRRYPLQRSQNQFKIWMHLKTTHLNNY